MIVDCAAAKEVSCIALTDHNSVGNCAFFKKYAEQTDLVLLFGMELTTSEEIHVLCLFDELEKAEIFGKYVEERTPKIKNDVQIFGNQILFNVDGTTSQYENFLGNATDISITGLYPIVYGFGGVAIPAHIDKSYSSVTSVFGMLDRDMGFPIVEVFKDPSQADLCGIPYIQDSDSHDLEWFIDAPYRQIEVSERSAKAVLEKLRSYTL